MRRLLTVAARALRGSRPDDDFSDTEESVDVSEGTIPAGRLPDAHHKSAAADPSASQKSPCSPPALVAPTVPTPPFAADAVPRTPPRRSSSRMPLELRRIGASPEAIASPSMPSSYNLRSRRRPIASTRTDSVAVSRPAFMHKRDVENASTITLRGVCNRFGIEATDGKEQMRARVLAKMAEKTTDDFSAKQVEEQADQASAVADAESADERANCLTTSTTKKNLASVNDPIVRGVGDVHGKSDKPDADVNLPPVAPAAPVESNPARSWVTDRSVMEKSNGQKLLPKPPLMIPNTALPPRASPPSPIYNPSESADVTAPLHAGSIFQDWLRTNRRLSTAEYEACVQALRGSIMDSNSLRRPSIRTATGTGSLGVAMIPSAIMKRGPRRSATLGLPSPVAANRARMPSTPGVRSSTGIPAANRTGVTQVMQHVPPTKASQDQAAEHHLKMNAPASGDVSIEMKTQGERPDNLLSRLQQSSQSMPMNGSSVAARKEGESVLPREHPLPSKFSGAVGGPNDYNIDRSSVGEKDKKEGKAPLDINWLDRLLGEKFKSVPMTENPQYGDMVPPQQLLQHFNESPIPTYTPNTLNSKTSQLVRGTAAKKKNRLLPPHPWETAARIRKRNQERARHSEWQERLRVLDKEKREEAKRSLYKKEAIESETGGELVDFRGILNKKKTIYELAQIRANQRPPSPPLPPRAQRALRFLKALKNETSKMQTRVRKPDGLPPLPPRLKKVRTEGGFTAATMFGDASSSESSEDYERPPDEIILWKRMKKKQLRQDRKSKGEAHGYDSSSSPKTNGSGVDGPTSVFHEKQVLAGPKKAESAMTNQSVSKSEGVADENAKDGAAQRTQSNSSLRQTPFSSFHGKKLGAAAVEPSNPFVSASGPFSSGFNALPMDAALSEAETTTINNGKLGQVENGTKKEDGKSHNLSFRGAPNLAGSRVLNPNEQTNEKETISFSSKPKTSDFNFSMPQNTTPEVKFVFGKPNPEVSEEKQSEAHASKQDWTSLTREKKTADRVEGNPNSAETPVAKSATGFDKVPNLSPAEVQREREARNVSDEVSRIEPSGSNGKPFNPSLPLSSVPAFANSQLQPTSRPGKDESTEETVSAVGGTRPTAAVFGSISNRLEDGSDRGEIFGAVKGPDAQDQALETNVPRSNDARTPVFGKGGFSISKQKEESLKADKPDLNSFFSHPTNTQLKENTEQQAMPSGSFAFTPSQSEPSKGSITQPIERRGDSKPNEKEVGPPMFTGSSAAPSLQQTTVSEPVTNLSAPKPVHVPDNSHLSKESVCPEDEKKSDADNPQSARAKEPPTFGAANQVGKDLLGKPSFGSQVTPGNLVGFNKSEVATEKQSEDVMATMGAPADKDPKSLFGLDNNKAKESPFGGFKEPTVAPTLFGSSKTQPTSAPFSFGKPGGNEQKKSSGPFGDAKFSSSFKTTGPPSSFVFGTSEPSLEQKSSVAGPAPFSTAASKPQATHTQPNPFAPSNASPFTAPPTGFGTTAQSQGFSFPGNSFAFGSSTPVGFGSSKPVDARSSFEAPSFGSSKNVGFGQGSKPTFSFGAPAAGSGAPAFGAPSGTGAPNPFGAQKPSQPSQPPQPSQPSENAFGTNPFGAQPGSRPLFSATPSAPFSQGNLFGGNSNTQSGLGGRPNEAPTNNNTFNTQAGQPGRPGAFAMGSTAAPVTRRKYVKARRTKR
ncbi:unnamed protein product [Agarophyton chilense]|eukprot:gb/GEZJ01000046.1/.p1 GENE.gb/GEZJ01000046.1/~~gb/GEZJ01000046.1/.p1  ORF type:complete len:1691 (+),score=260.02 gb/GEZJ01000046.1/:452-5524(+)